MLPNVFFTWALSSVIYFDDTLLTVPCVISSLLTLSSSSLSLPSRCSSCSSSPTTFFFSKYCLMFPFLTLDGVVFRIFFFFLFSVFLTLDTFLLLVLLSIFYKSIRSMPFTMTPVTFLSPSILLPFKRLFSVLALDVVACGIPLQLSIPPFRVHFLSPMLVEWLPSLTGLVLLDHSTGGGELVGPT